MKSDEFDIQMVDSVSTLWVDHRRLEECLSYYREHSVDLLGINPMRGYSGRDIDFLRACPFVRGLVIVSPLSGGFDLEPVRSLRDLRSLTVSDRVSLDLGEFPALEKLRVVWDEKLRIEGCSNLRLLDLSKFRPRTASLRALPVLPRLETLELVQSPLASLDGIEKFPALRHLGLAHMRMLRELSAVRASNLESLFCEACPGLGDYPVLGEVKGLRRLRLNRCAEIHDLNFLDDLPHLEEFRFVGTRVTDGNLLHVLRLRSVGFDGKRHYSHTPKEVEAIVARNRAGRWP